MNHLRRKYADIISARTSSEVSAQKIIFCHKVHEGFENLSVAPGNVVTVEVLLCFGHLDKLINSCAWLIRNAAKIIIRLVLEVVIRCADINILLEHRLVTESLDILWESACCLKR